jgi:RHS repeat-associated protein
MLHIQTMNSESRTARARFYPWLQLCASVLIFATVTLHDNSALAGTPHSQARSCGAPGQSACPASTPIVTPWTYGPNSPFYPTPSNARFNSIAEINSWFSAIYTSQGWCTMTYTGTVESPPAQSYQYGILVYYNITTNYLGTEPNTGTPLCGYSFNHNEVSSVERTVSCPVGLTVSYQSSPALGPTCSLPTATANALKQTGCPTCGAATVKSDPADISNGNHYQAEVDYVGVGNNPLKFVRSYNSLTGWLVYFNGTQQIGEQYVGNAGWSATYFQYLLPVSVTDSTTTYNTVYAYRPDGRMLTFNEYNNVYSPDGDVADRLVPISGGGWQYQTADDTIETYNAAGQLLSVATRGQAPVTINYNAGSGLGDPPVSVSDAFGHSLQFAYLFDATGVQRLTSITDPNGKVISYTYDTYGRITAATYPDSTTRQYSYDTVTNGWLLVSLTDEAGAAYASWTHGNYGSQVLTSQLAGGVAAYSFSYATNSHGTITSATVTDPLGQSRTYAQQLVSGVNRTTTTSSACPGCGDDQARVLDADGNITSRTDWNVNVTTYAYDTTNNLETSRTEAYGTAQARTITTTWDPSWRQPDLITEPNRTTAFTYDGMGNVLTKKITDTTVTPNATRTWTYNYDSYGRMLTVKGPRTDVNSTTTYAYYTCTTGTQCGEIQTITDAVGHVTTFNTYNAHGQPLTITDPNGVVTTLTYDLRQRLLSRQVGPETTSYSYYPTGLLKLVTLPDGSDVVYTYDNAHRLTKITDGLGNYISYTLDAVGNRTAIKTYDPSSALHRTHTRVFNALNELYQDVNAAGTSAVTTTYGYDSNGNQASIAAPLSRNTADQYDALNRLIQITDPNNGITKLGYDANDNLASVKDPRSLTTSYSHNGFGDVTQTVSPDTGTTINTYDSGGNLKTATDARTALATYAYDALNRVTQVAYSDETINFTYDAGTNGVGRLTGASDVNHSMSWAYDTHGRVTGKGQIVGGVTKSVGYAYSNGDLTSFVTPSGQTVTYTYTNHRVMSITINSTALLSGVTYDPFGPATGWTWGNSTSVSRAYDEDGNPHQILTAGVTNGYTVDNAERITGLSDSGLSSNTWTFGYDLLDRATGGSSSALTRGYTYDANSNRLTETGTVAYTASITSTDNQIASTSGGLVRTYSYDAIGNTTGYGSNSYTFNQRGRMSVANVGGATYYVYNALGQLIEKYGNGGTTLLMYDEAGHLLGEYSSTGALIEETIWMGDIPVATLRPNGSTGCTSTLCIFYVHSDHLRTPRKITRPSDNGLMWRWDPDTFGSMAPNSNPAGLGTFIYNLRFPGQYALTETGLNYNYFRDYDPQTGRYLESDPIGLKGGSYSTYAYARGNPISYTDPSGLSVQIIGSDPMATTALTTAYNQVANTPTGAALINALENSPILYLITNNPLTPGANYFDPYNNIISVDPYSPAQIHVNNACGSEAGSTFIALAHEIGHAATGALDNGPGGMGNITLNENPIRLENNMPLRTDYQRVVPYFYPHY